MKAVLAPKLTSSNRLMGPWGALSPSQIEEVVVVTVTVVVRVRDRHFAH